MKAIGAFCLWMLVLCIYSLLAIAITVGMAQFQPWLLIITLPVLLVGLGAVTIGGAEWFASVD